MPLSLRTVAGTVPVAGQSWLEYVAMTPQEHFARQRNAEVRCLILEAGGDGQNYTYQQCISWFKSEGFTSGFAEKLWAKCAEHVVRPAGVSGSSGSGGPRALQDNRERLKGSEGLGNATSLLYHIRCG